jgi:hypothetical protein
LKNIFVTKENRIRGMLQYGFGNNETNLTFTLRATDNDGIVLGSHLL